jgi:hypothetical protein
MRHFLFTGLIGLAGFAVSASEASSQVTPNCNSGTSDQRIDCLQRIIKDMQDQLLAPSKIQNGDQPLGFDIQDGSFHANRRQTKAWGILHLTYHAD